MLVRPFLYFISQSLFLIAVCNIGAKNRQSTYFRSSRVWSYLSFNKGETTFFLALSYSVKFQTICTT